MAGNTTLSEAQILCDSSVRLDYFAGVGTPCSSGVLTVKIMQLMAVYPNKQIYIGVTHHPCGRFTGSKTTTTPVPTKLNLDYEFSDMEMITEEAHNETYTHMFLICHANSRTDIFRSEQMALVVANQIDTARVINDAAGGNGNLPNSEIYWLYVCINNGL